MSSTKFCFISGLCSRIWPTSPISRTRCHEAAGEHGRGERRVCTGLFSLIFSSWLHHVWASSQTSGLKCWRCLGIRTHTNTSQSNLFSMLLWRLWGAARNSMETMQRSRWTHDSTHRQSSRSSSAVLILYWYIEVVPPTQMQLGRAFWRAVGEVVNSNAAMDFLNTTRADPVYHFDSERVDSAMMMLRQFWAQTLLSARAKEYQSARYTLGQLFHSLQVCSNACTVNTMQTTKDKHDSPWTMISKVEGLVGRGQDLRAILQRCQNQNWKRHLSWL